MSSLHSLLRAFYWLTPLVVWPMSCLYCSMHAFDRPSPCGTDMLISSTWHKESVANERSALFNACPSLAQFLAQLFF